MTRTVLITGCSSGIGRATAEAFLEDEWTVWATARDEDDLTALAEAGAETAELDVTNARECERVVEQATDEEPLDCLVNNAGISQRGAVEEIPTERLHHQLDVNLYGPHRLIRAALPGMRRAGEGRIVNVSSVVQRVSPPGSGAYAASKAALESLSDALRAEVEGEGIEVVQVEPGPVATEFEATARESLRDVDRTGTYEWLYDAYEDAQDVGRGPLSVPPEAVAETIRDAACASDPATRYPVGQVAKLAGLAAHLPDRWRDAVVGLLRSVA
ncbi:MAG: SDR family oxidoreductase [Haloarculaceae archaeon]